MVFPLPTGTISVLRGIFSGFLLVLHQYIFCFFPKQLFENSCVIYTCTLSFCTVHYFYECTKKNYTKQKKRKVVCYMNHNTHNIISLYSTLNFIIIYSFILFQCLSMLIVQNVSAQCIYVIIPHCSFMKTKKYTCP